ncbi:MAG: hypothetical protein AB7K86_21090 [Rhodospirillales bacterium]
MIAARTAAARRRTGRGLVAADLQGMSDAELAALWRRLTGQPPAIVAPRELMARILAEELRSRRRGATRQPA